MDDFQKAVKRVSEVIAQSEGNADRFANTLKKERIPHLSFSQVTTVEFCEYRYYLQYIEMEEPSPLPDYFTKGRFMHELIADTYQGYRLGSDNGRVSVEKRIGEKVSGESKNHLLNAYQVHIKNLWKDYEIIAVEHPFVMEIGQKLPPMVGVIDLILKQNSCFVLVDHKTGRNFYPYDALQVAIYGQYIHAAYQGTTCRLFYDHYRWVNNLDRIRKPAFQRTEVSADFESWPMYLERIRRTYALMRKIKMGSHPSRYGECFRCPYRNNCRRENG